MTSVQIVVADVIRHVLSPMADVVDNGPANVFQKRQLYAVSGLDLPHPDPVARSVKIIQFQMFDADASQTEPCDKHNDRIVSFTAGIAFRALSSTRSLRTANRRKDPTAHSFCSTVFA